VDPAEDPQAPGRELESYLAALSPEGDLESTGSGRAFGNSQVYQLRLQLMADAQLRELAEAYGTSPAALAQEWVMQRLTWEADQRATRARQPQAPAWPS
jgi:aryl-alcohol dehydrogenase-like predicted oxidoreductase